MMLTNLSKYEVILASNSPRRRELLTRLGVDFKVFTLMGIDESYPQGLSAHETVLHILRKKAQAYHCHLSANKMIITADTIVAVDNQILGKPKDAQQAKEMLRLVRGREHEVITAFSVCTSLKTVEEVVTTKVKFADVSEDIIDHYVSKFLPFDKAGGYGIQEWIGMVAIEEIHGSYYNVVGLPVQQLYHVLEQF